jgi:hypothetical protein
LINIAINAIPAGLRSAAVAANYIRGAPYYSRYLFCVLLLDAIVGIFSVLVDTFGLQYISLNLDVPAALLVASLGQIRRAASAGKHVVVV